MIGNAPFLSVGQVLILIKTNTTHQGEEVVDPAVVVVFIVSGDTAIIVGEDNHKIMREGFGDEPDTESE